MSKRVGVEIITIGDEILIGQIVDTNSAWMAVELNKAGFDVVQITSVHDQADHIVEALKLALGRADVVLFTGGIGPTNDDITKLTLANFFDSRLVYDPSVIDNIENLFANKPGFVINELTRSQAMVPECSLVIQNKVGTAPVLWFETEGKIVVSMPGNGNMVYGIFTVNEDCDEYVVPLEMGIDDVDIFVSKDYDEKI
jgi:nicotinamide-nucleotide amidase